MCGACIHACMCVCVCVHPNVSKCVKNKKLHLCTHIFVGAEGPLKTVAFNPLTLDHASSLLSKHLPSTTLAHARETSPFSSHMATTWLPHDRFDFSNIICYFLEHKLLKCM